jgi:tRNA-dihydrouridine synthase 3
MGLAVSFLQGSKEEWSLVRRHPSERVFGVQIAGNTPATLANTAEAIGRQCDGNIDFVDLNCGCPIDLVYQQGAGSARKSTKAPIAARILLIFTVLSMGAKLGKMVKGMAYALGDIPVTVKMRTGVKDNLPTAHKLFPKAHAWGAGAVAVSNERLRIVLVLILVLAPRPKSTAALLTRS